MGKDKEIPVDGNEAEGNEKEVKEDNGKKVSRAKYEKALEDLAKSEADRDYWKNEYYRAYADTQNLRKSLEEDKRTAVRYRAEGFLTELLPALDAFHMALEMPAPTPEAKNYQIGFTYIHNQIVSALTNEGVTEICPKLGDPYNLETMHAVDTIETTEYPPGTICKVQTKGYKLHDRLIRPVMVCVAKAPKPAEEPQENETPSEEQPEEPKPNEA